MRTDYRTAAWMLGLVLALGAGCEHNKLTVAAVPKRLGALQVAPKSRRGSAVLAKLLQTQPVVVERWKYVATVGEGPQQLGVETFGLVKGLTFVALLGTLKQRRRIVCLESGRERVIVDLLDDDGIHLDRRWVGRSVGSRGGAAASNQQMEQERGHWG